jgi:hypothetical protein
MFASHTRARTTNVHLALATTKKDNMTVAQYYGKMKGLADEMAAAGKPLDNEELVMYICNGLDTEYNSLVSALVTRLEPIAPSELYSQLLSFETRLELQLGSGSSPSANSAGRNDRGGDSKGVASIVAPIVAEVDDSILTAGLVAADVVSSSHHARINSGEPSPLDLPRPMTTMADLSVRSASRQDTRRLIAGIGLMKTMSQKNAMLLLL